MIIAILVQIRPQVANFVAPVETEQSFANEMPMFSVKSLSGRRRCTHTIEDPDFYPMMGDD